MVQKYVRLQSLDAEAASVDRCAPDAEWRLYREVAGIREDVTADVVRTLKAGPRGAEPTPARGFIVPR